jgi:hypothetical protein
VEAYNQDGRNLMLNDKISVYGQCPQFDKENDDDFTKILKMIAKIMEKNGQVD